ncbi:DNA polymerase epsilon subunit B [Trichomonascus vanleenenianus]|uniref:DNA polymerase epsilon noncatalytic subunit n=1 Tax=Trichomonascus vanleenenianus TaxID=2268995 RepID=UPI003ECAF45E
MPDPSAPAVLPTQLTSSQVRPVAYRILSKKHGLNLKSSGLEVLAKTLGRRFGVDWRGSKGEKFLDEIARRWKEQDRGLFMDGEPLSAVIRDIINAEASVNQQIAQQNSEPIPAQRSKSSFKPFHWTDYFQIVNAQDQPAYRYSPSRHHFSAPEGIPKLIGSARARVNMFSTRYHILNDRVHRDEAFLAPSVQSGGSNYHQITLVKNMLGRNNSDFLLLGLLTKGADGEFYLQDSSGRMKLEFTPETAPSDQVYFTPGSYILCAGIYYNERFIVDSFGPPPPEKREVTRNAYGFVDFLGVHSACNVTASGSKASRVERIDRAFEKQLRQQERQLNHRMVILGANIFLDQLRVLDGLRKVFGQLEAEAEQDGQAPISVIFPGSFSSLPYQPNGSTAKYKESFDILAQVIAEFPTLAANSMLVFVPGDNDPWAASFSSGATPSWPMCSIPSIFTNRVKRAAKKTAWGSNPTKMTYMSQEITIVRDDYGAKFNRNSVVFGKDPIIEPAPPTESSITTAAAMEVDESTQLTENFDGKDDEEERMAQKQGIDYVVSQSQKTFDVSVKRPQVSPELAEARKVVRTLLDQGHLSPFPITVRPVYWEYDHSLYLSPLPSMLILADPTTPQFKVTYEGCYVVNPGPFLEKNRVNWLEYNTSEGIAYEKFLYL